MRIDGVPDREMRRELEAASVMRSLENRPPLSEVQLRRRARRDPPLYQEVLRSRGFYAAEIETVFELDRRRPRVRFVVDRGEPYTLRHVRIVDAESGQTLSRPDRDELELGPEHPAEAGRILDAEERLLMRLRAEGRPFPAVVEREVVVVHAARAVDVTFRVRRGEILSFGTVTFEGLERTDPAFLERKIPWERGDQYDGDLVRLARRRFLGADLFSTLRVLTVDEPDDEGLLPIRVEVSERKPRSVTLAGGYRNDQGWWSLAGWEHRNFLRRGERLSLEYGVSEEGFGGEIVFRRPDVRRVDQTLTLRASQEVEDTRAYESERVGLLAVFDRPLVWGWHGDAGLGYRYSSVSDAQGTRDFSLAYLPLGLSRDGSDDTLDPRRGYRISVGAAPYVDVPDGELFFVKSRVSGTLYQRLLRSPEIDWAGRAALAVIAGEARNAIPTDERYFTGGGGSLRGYPYQTVGPLEDGVPTGGRSMILLSQELRWRLGDSFGITAFLDGGAVTEEVWFDETVDDFRWGAGLGLRYFTPVGPLRLDFAVPLNRRREIDDPWQFYVSLGQAF
ncbi:MAG: BamA/TamA family outer membrane protein [Kiritimatiellae bacterium]|nr:BamA/TamA family outer membrane protein [Kiritimatiellia bacterium]